MIIQDKRKAVFTLFQEGRSKKEIASLLQLDPKTVRRIIAKHGALPDDPRDDKITVDHDLLEKLYHDCEGYVQRVHEKLLEEHEIRIGYSTLTRLVKEAGLGQPILQRCFQVPDKPGAEMQHDTSPFNIKIGGVVRKMVCSGLYFRYSKMRHIKFYQRFNRFTMKCFMYEALIHFGYVAGICVIDNTNLAVWYGTGSQAVFTPEMVSFAKNCGDFDWLAHEKGHSNRKAGKERNFFTVETNFFPGRTFKSLEDLNAQALDWAAVRYAKRPQSKTKLIPVELFEIEKPHLKKLPPYVEPPCLVHERVTNQYGYISFSANYYWVPGTSRETVKVIEYPDCIKIFKKREMLVEYALPAEGTRHKMTAPEGAKTNPYEVTKKTIPADEEEGKLRQIDTVVGEYLDFIKSENSVVRYRHKFIRALFFLSKKIEPTLFLKAIARALTYRVAHIPAITRIASELMQRGLYPSAIEDNIKEWGTDEYETRETYLNGQFSSEPDMESYQALIDNVPATEDDNDNHKD